MIQIKESDTVIENPVVTDKREANKKKNVYTKLQEVRCYLQKLRINKSGYNSFNKFKYYELGDFIPSANELFQKIGLMGYFNLYDQEAELDIVNTDAPDEKIKFVSKIPNVFEANKGQNLMQVVGSLHTYMRRYLYVNALELVESDIIDSLGVSNVIGKISGNSN